MERKFYDKYTALKVPLARFFLAAFLCPRPRWLDAAVAFFPVGSLAASQKRKLLDEGLERKREAELKELYDGKARPLNLGWVMGGRVLGETVSFSLHFDIVSRSDDAAMKDWVRGLENDKEELFEKL
jgi:hypothetical protein